jgi:hypothetical protein
VRGLAARDALLRPAATVATTVRALSDAFAVSAATAALALSNAIVVAPSNP